MRPASEAKMEGIDSLLASDSERARRSPTRSLAPRPCVTWVPRLHIVNFVKSKSETDKGQENATTQVVYAPVAMRAELTTGHRRRLRQCQQPPNRTQSEA